MPAAALAIPAVIGAGSSIFNGISGRNAAKAAGTAQANAAEDTIKDVNARLGEGDKAIDTATGTASSWTAPASDWAQSLMMPYIQGGQGAETQLNSILGAPVQQFSYDPSKVADDPGYQFTLAQGMKALEQSAAARGQSLSGGQLKALGQFSQGNAATYENQFYNQTLSTFDTNRDTLQQRVGNLFGQTSQGMQGGQYAGTTGLNQAEFASTAEQNAAALKAKLGLDATAQEGNARTGGANATAASTLGANGSFTNGITNAGNDIGQAIFLSQLMKKPPGTATTNSSTNTGWQDTLGYGG
jgi:hypothetical protein